MAETREQKGINGEDASTTTSSGAAQNGWVHRERETLQGVLHRIISTIFFPEVTTGSALPCFQRIKMSLSENVPLLKEASANTGGKILLWTRRGSPIRALFVISVCTLSPLRFQLYYY
uniref:Uncharacterized protein n=1 Tax=Rhizophora mucronata TaxID=61149 RepID=A0A2P2JLZ7_RHIMU